MMNYTREKGFVNVDHFIFLSDCFSFSNSSRIFLRFWVGHVIIKDKNVARKDEG